MGWVVGPLRKPVVRPAYLNPDPPESFATSVARVNFWGAVAPGIVVLGRRGICSQQVSRRLFVELIMRRWISVSTMLWAIVPVAEGGGYGIGCDGWRLEGTDLAGGGDGMGVGLTLS